MASTWTRYEPPDATRFPKLDRDMTADAVIVGGGITGTTAAYLLAKAGRNVVLLEKGTLPDSASAYTTAFLTNIVDTGFTELCDLFGEENAKVVWQSHAEAIDEIERIADLEAINCEFVRTEAVAYANDADEWEAITRDARRAERSGFPVELREGNGIGIKNSGYVIVKNQAKFHPLKYLFALRAKAVENGAAIFEHTEVKEIAGEGSVQAVTENGTITAESALIATHDPFDKPAQLFARKGVYTTYILELGIPAGLIPEGIYEDEKNPYHYFRIDPVGGGQDRCIIGGEDHRHEVPLDPEKAYARISDYFSSILPGISYEVMEKWSGPIVEPDDGLAFIGTYSDKYPRAFTATGFSGNGMTYGTLSAMMFSDFAEGRDVRFAGLYDPRRPRRARALWQKGKEYAEEFVQGYGRAVFDKPDSKEG